jgi:hypothetical protein
MRTISQMTNTGYKVPSRWLRLDRGQFHWANLAAE